MKTAACLLVAALTAAVAPAAGAGEANPISKVLQLLSDLQTKIQADGVQSLKVYKELSEWCEERSKNLGFEIKTAKADAAALKASIAQETALASSLASKIEDLASSIATDEADVKAATEIRTKEAADFVAEEKELTEVIDTLERAISILEREMRKGGSMVQLKSASSLAQALGALVQASALNSADASRLTALVQSSDSSDDADADAGLGAPAGAVYKGQSGGIIQTLEDLLEKAQDQLADARKKETIATQNFQLLKQSLQDSIQYGNKEMAEAKKGLEASREKKATAQGDLGATSKVLGQDAGSLEGLRRGCLAKAQDFEAATRSRGEELKAIADAKRVIAEETVGAERLSYGLDQVSLVQLGRAGLASGTDLANFEAVHFVRDLARKERSPALTQLASRMAAAMRAGVGSGDDPFAKVKGLIADMIDRLEAEANADASHKAYCDKELAYASTKKDDRDAESAKLGAQIDQLAARSQQLKGEVAELQKALAELAAAGVQMDKVRKEEHDTFVKAKADLQQGLEGVKLALKVLREYYAGEKQHEAAEGAGAGIIGLLEVIESDFSKGLVEMTTTEDSAQASYEQQVKENEIEKATEDKDVEYKTKEAAGLDKAIGEASSDRSGVQAELDAVQQYLDTLKKQCIEKAETYAERKARFEAELAGLKEALKILSSEAVLLERGSRHALRGVRRHQ